MASSLVEVTVPRGRYRRLDFAVVHATDRRWGATKRDGVPTVTPLRLVLELGASATAGEVERVVDDFVRRKLLTWPNVRAAREREACRGRRGLGAVGRVLEERLLDALPTDSRLEVAMARLFRQAGLRLVEFHPTLRIGGRRLVPDFVLRAEKVIVEVDGYGFHGDRRSFESDRARDALLAGSGWLVLRFTWRQVVERPAEVIDRLRSVVRVRRPRGS
jgi:very-short-patch-repair endonuclease